MDGLNKMPNPWTFHGLILWLIAIGFAVQGLVMLIGMFK